MIAPLQELIEEARETLAASSVPLGMTEAQFYRNLVHLAWGILSRDVSDDAHPPIVIDPNDEERLIADAKAAGFRPGRVSRLPLGVHREV